MLRLRRVLRRAGTLSVIVALIAAGGTLAKKTPAKPRPVPVKTGYYTTLTGVKSAGLAFHVRTGGLIGDLTFTCVPVAPDASSITNEVAVHAPQLTIANGQLSFSGPAKVSSTLPHAPTLALTTIKLSAQHTTGPEYQYTSGTTVLQQTRAWTGTVSSPACRSIFNRGRFTLFGPFPGE